MPTMTRQAAIKDYCRSCICDEENGGRWTEQTAVCSTVDCPLWRFRPVPSTAAAWVKARDPEQVPADWNQLDHAKAIRCLYEEIDASVRKGLVSGPLPTTQVGAATTLPPPSPRAATNAFLAYSDVPTEDRGVAMVSAAA